MSPMYMCVGQYKVLQVVYEVLLVVYEVLQVYIPAILTCMSRDGTPV